MCLVSDYKITNNFYHMYTYQYYKMIIQAILYLFLYLLVAPN